MSTIAEVAGRFAKLNLNREAQIAIGKTSKAMVRMQQRQRLETGKNQDGRDIGPAYRMKGYRELKIEAGHGDFVDLNLTGETDSKMFVDVEADTFTIESSGELFPKLEKKYGEKAYGLNEDYMGKYIDEAFGPQFYAQIEKITGLEMK
jgi:hypothetical protein